MDDLLGQDWSGKPAQPASNNPFSKPLSTYPGPQPSPVPSIGNGIRPSPAPEIGYAIRPSPAPAIGSGIRPSPAPSIGNGTRPSPAPSTGNGTRPTTPANDSFANLLGRTAPKGTATLTLQERQKQLLEEKRKQELERNKLYATQFGAGDAWDSLGSGARTPASGRASPAVVLAHTNSTLSESDDDILAAFNSSVRVDKSSHFPPPSSTSASGSATPVFTAPTSQPRTIAPLQHNPFPEDDDPFGLGALPQKNTTFTKANAELDDEDILGDLAKPVCAKPQQRSTVDDAFDVAQEARTASPVPPAANNLDRAVAELVDMGFPADTSKIALLETDGHVQAAVSFLLNQAHQESKQKSHGSAGSRRGTPLQSGHAAEAEATMARASSQRRGRETDALPAWMRQDGRASSSQPKVDSNSTGSDKDVAQYASEIGSTLFKSANSLWKQGRKQVQKAVQDFNSDHDPAQPKWMRDTSTDSEQTLPTRRRQAEPRDQPPTNSSLTDEAVLLDSGDGRPSKPTRIARRPDASQDSRSQAPLAQHLPVRSSPQPRLMQPTPPPQQDKRPASKLSRLEVEAQAEQAYISPARRKRPEATAPPQVEPEIDLFGPAPAVQTTAAKALFTQSPSSPRPVSQTLKTRSTAPQRTIPAVSSSALSISTTHRHAGTEAFKRGDFDAAHTSYTSALNPLPPTHPLTILLFTNRALTALKTGDPKMAISDADRALALIGPSLGDSETLDVDGVSKDMRDYYGKALLRKAEALEHMEKWADAAGVYRLCVGSGVGGANAIRARDRCEKACAPATSSSAPSSFSSTPGAAKPASAAPKSLAAAPLAKPQGRSIAPSRPAVPAAQSTAAVRALREANAAAERADDEKFALNDVVEARLAAWKGTKSDNLRALLGSLDTVLWADCGWKKVGMSELVVPGRVKIVYMKAIGKVHPDKVSLLSLFLLACVFACLAHATFRLI